MKPAFELAEILEKHWDKVQNLKFNTWQYRTLDALKRCRTASLGGHIDACNACGHLTLSYNSCRNRHCNKCQGQKREDWIIARESELLPVPYFQRDVAPLVFTLPSELNPVAMYEPKILYDILFKVSWEVMQAFSKDRKHLDAQSGMIAVLHTWGQNLSLHPHIHCIVPGGGIDKNGNWRCAKNKGKFLFPVKAMAKVFRAKFVAELRKQLILDQRLYNGLFLKDWVVYAKRPFGNPKAVIEYLGRYTHKVAISNHRIKSIDNETVIFTYKDYRDQSKVKLMTLTHEEFIRRFSQHILPKRFVRIRHYGILSSTWKRSKLANLQIKLGLMPIVKVVKVAKMQACPSCKKGKMVTILAFDSRGPPEGYVQLLNLVPSPTL